MFLAKELGKTLEEIMEITDFEFRMWIAWFKIQRKEQEKQIKNGRNQHRRKTHR